MSVAEHDRSINLVALQRGVSTIGWGYAISLVLSGWLPSTIGLVTVLIGLMDLPLESMSRELVTRRRLVVAAVIVAFAGEVAGAFPVTAPVGELVSPWAGVLGIVLFVAMMTRLSELLGAPEPRRAWRRLNVAIIAVAGVSAMALLAMTTVVPRLPGYDGATSDAGLTISGWGSGLALGASVALSVAVLAAAAAAVGFAFRAFSTMKRWIEGMRPSPASDIDGASLPLSAALVSAHPDSAKQRAATSLISGTSRSASRS